MSAKPETAPYRAAFAPADSFAEKRREAFARFETLGFPTRRDEAWRFTNLRPLQDKAFAPAAGKPGTTPTLDPYFFAGETHRVVLVNGRFAPTLSKIDRLPQGVTLGAAAEIAGNNPSLASRLLDQTDLAGGQAFASLNAALFADGFVLALEPGVALETPVEIIHWGEAVDSSFHLRNLIQLGAGSRATIIESYAGSGRYWTNAVAVVDLGAGAALLHAKLQDEASDAIHFGQVRARIPADARYESFVLTLGGRLSRHDSFATFAGEQATCGLFGAYLLKGEQEATNATFVDHAVPKCTTDEVFKGVVDERAHGVFLGKITVRPQAQKTNANQLNKNLLLSARANVDTKPELEILADDVKCSHGATVGDLDESAMFYLAARGIPADEARRMLIEAFAADAIDRLEDAPALRVHLLAHVRRWLGRKD
ncbi:MAG TPA: Fe-S cluster assembly protein SufD [Stellaceae bacterium]|jgi:Fe-S cluster assembly protein SufD